MPSTSANTSGGITQADVDLLTQRKLDVQDYINNGGSHLALTQAVSPTPYAWLELPLPFSITDFNSGGISFPLRKTPEGIAAGLTISDAELSNGVPIIMIS